jgi:hypothetical protein
MSYIVFDLDETLAELYSTFYFIASLKPELEHTIPDNFKEQLAQAYKLFVKKVLVQELSSTGPLGILRPGILNVFEIINRLKSNGQVKGVVIYSNNGHLESLEFIRDLIHQHLSTSDLILECIHWGHHLREEERSYTQGAANKTWKVLSTILKGPIVGAPADLQTDDVYFFDDINHQDLKKYLKSNYIQVPSYTFKASFDTLSHLFTEAIDEADVNIEMFVDIASEILDDSLESYDEILMQYKQRTQGTSKTPASIQEDQGIKLMKQALSTISNSPTQMSSKGGKRKRRQWNGKTRRHKSKIQRRKRGRRTSKK